MGEVQEGELGDQQIDVLEYYVNKFCPCKNSDVAAVVSSCFVSK